MTQKYNSSEKLLKPTKGIFKMYTLDDLGNEEVIIEKKNLIVNTSFDIISGCLLGDTNKQINTIKIGDGGIINGVQQPPKLTDTSLYHEIFSKTGLDNTVIEKVLFPNYINFNFVISKDEANGTGSEIVNEAALASNDGTIFSRLTFPENIKTPQKQISISWRLIYE